MKNENAVKLGKLGGQARAKLPKDILSEIGRKGGEAGKGKKKTRKKLRNKSIFLQ